MKKLFKTNLIIPFLFFTSIYASFLGYVFRVDVFSDIDEKRTYSRIPSLKFSYDSLILYPENFESNFNDNFGLRKLYIFLNCYIKYKILGVSGSSKVIVGKEDWLFYKDTLSCYQDSGILNQNYINRWRIASEIKRVYFKKHGIKYYFVVVPNKNSVYPEYMPKQYSKITPDTPIDRLEIHMLNNSKVNFLNTKKCFIAGKNNSYKSFYKTDTHINYYGAFLISNAIIEMLSNHFPQCQPMPESNFKIINYKNYPLGGDLARMLALHKLIKDDWVFFELKPQWSFKNESSIKIIDPDYIYLKDVYSPPIETSKNDSLLPKAIMFRDSCSKSIIPFFSENFSYIKYIWKNIESDIQIDNYLDKFKPDMIIEEIVERNLMRLPSVPNDISKDLFWGSSDKVVSLNSEECENIFRSKDNLSRKTSYLVPVPEKQGVLPLCFILRIKLLVSDQTQLNVSCLRDNPDSYTIDLNKGENEAFIVLSEKRINELKINFTHTNVNFKFELIEIREIYE